MLETAVSRRRARVRRTASLVLALGVSACATTRPQAPASASTEPVKRALFIGNSYLYHGDIPGIVQALADSAGGERLLTESVTAPDFALVDHWFRGASGAARRNISRGGWDWVVLQQGPSSIQINRDSLRMMAKRYAELITRNKGRPALFSAWPSQDRWTDFARAIESYRLAAQEANALLLPVAAAWLAVWERNRSVLLYHDGLHPSDAGSYLSALVVYSTLLGKSPRGLPNRLRLASGSVIEINPELARLLQDAAAQVAGAP